MNGIPLWVGPFIRRQVAECAKLRSYDPIEACACYYAMQEYVGGQLDNLYKFLPRRNHAYVKEVTIGGGANGMG